MLWLPLFTVRLLYACLKERLQLLIFVLIFVIVSKLQSGYCQRISFSCKRVWPTTGRTDTNACWVSTVLKNSVWRWESSTSAEYWLVCRGWNTLQTHTLSIDAFTSDTVYKYAVGSQRITGGGYSSEKETNLMLF